MQTLGGAIRSHGVRFAVVFTTLMLCWDAMEGEVPPWPRSALKYAVTAVLGAVLYGITSWWLDRRSPSRETH
jgi:hypothetical protein